MNIHDRIDGCVDCLAYLANGDIPDDPIRADGLDRNLRNMKDVDFTPAVVPALTLACSESPTEVLTVLRDLMECWTQHEDGCCCEMGTRANDTARALLARIGESTFGSTMSPAATRKSAI